ncbi:MAG: hypothetical protein HY424_02540, partial [Candidatus Levybacteria bacterium]|nr:hypothetical protein [Candidatus Levybacteria bacterium]
ISFDRASYNIGDTVLMSIQTTVPNIFVDIDASIASGGKGYSGSTSLTTDTKGEISYKFPVSSSTPDGIYKVNAKTNVPGCDAVSSSNSITINSGGGYCGDKLCNNKESSNTCPTDCGDVGDGYCPSSKTCSDGKTMPCDKYLGTCHCAPCEFDPGRVPPGCTQSSDSSTAVLRVNCDLSCPPPPSDISVLKQKCIDNGGNPTLKTTYNGCNYFDCNFADEENFYTGPDRCFTEKELEEVNAKCTKLGLPIKIKVHGDCKIASCTQKEENTRCAVILSSERKSIESECKLQGLQLIKKFDEKGCQRLKCGTPDDCDKELPEAAYNDCSLKGGEIIVKKDVNDCITSTKCITPSDERDDAIGDISVLPSKAELTHVALELTEVSIELEKLTEEANKIKDYYGSTDSPKEEIWSRVVSALQTMSKRIEEIQNDLRDIVDSDEITKDNVLTVKASLIGVSNAFDDVLYLMLSSKIEADVREEKECETADECFDRAFRICQPTSFSPDQNTNVKITGLEDGKCILEAELDEKAAPPEGTIPGVGPPYTMTCNVEDYALGIDNPETSIFPYCEGSMLELVKYYKTQESPKIQEQEQIDEEAISEEQAYIPVTGQVIAYLEANHGPRNCVGKLECTKICDKEPYTCIGYIDSWLRTNSGPGGVRSIAELNNFCSSNKEICKEWLLSRGITLQELQQSKSYSTGPITGFAIRR